MKKNFVIVVTIAAMLGGGFPLFDPGDVNHDRVVDLRDTIMRVKDLAGTEQGSGEFGRHLADLLNALKATAGLKTLLSADDADAGNCGPTFLDAPFFVSMFHFAQFPEFGPRFIPLTQRFCSIDSMPPFHPPRTMIHS